jgi:ABC-type nitrate/sulfonate/bicarbonate transport system substrate-binding protein
MSVGLAMIQKILISVAVLFIATTTGAQELKKVKIGYPAISYNQIHIWVAKDAGLFKKHGLDAERNPICEV